MVESARIAARQMVLYVRNLNGFTCDEAAQHIISTIYVIWYSGYLNALTIQCILKTIKRK